MSDVAEAEVIHGSGHYVRCRDDNGRACEVCRRGHADAAIAGNRVRAERLAADPTLAPHGQSSTYGNWGCRCEPCREASRAKRRQYPHNYSSRRRLDGTPYRPRPPRATPIGREWLNQEGNQPA